MKRLELVPTFEYVIRANNRSAKFLEGSISGIFREGSPCLIWPMLELDSVVGDTNNP